MKYLQRFLITFLVVLPFFVETACAQNSTAPKNGFTLEQVMSSPFPTALTSAAKANRIAWVFDSKGERNVWVADAPDFAARQITHYQGDNGQDIFAVKPSSACAMLLPV